MERQTVKVTIEWYSVAEQPPPTYTFFPLLIRTPEGVRTARYVGDAGEPGEATGSLVGGFERGGWWFTAVTHWAFMNDVFRAISSPGDDAAAIKFAMMEAF